MPADGITLSGVLYKDRGLQPDGTLEKPAFAGAEGESAFSVNLSGKRTGKISFRRYRCVFISLRSCILFRFPEIFN